MRVKRPSHPSGVTLIWMDSPPSPDRNGHAAPKRPGEKPTDDQLNFGIKFTLAGGTYIVATSIDDLQAAGL
jgi:hypothetical protein